MQSRRDFRPARRRRRRRRSGARTALADDGPPEATTLRIVLPRMCLAPDLLAEDLLRAEGFNDIRYVTPGKGSQVASGELDFD